MNNKWLMIVLMGFIIGIMSGCSQAEDILEKISQLLDQQVEDETDEEKVVAENQNEEDNINEAEENHDNNENEAENLENEQNTVEEVVGGIEHELPFDERLIEQGYNADDVLPNGFPFSIPYQWILVENNYSDPSAEGLEGTFCFDIPMGIQEIAESFDERLPDISLIHEHYGEGNEIIHTSSFEPESGGWNGYFEYFLDQYDNTCVETTISYGGDEAEGEQVYGEDPDTMMSEDEMAAEQEGIEEEDRERSLPSDYAEKLNHHREPGDLVDMDTDADDILSIREKISNDEIGIDLFRLIKGQPRIFPYEWFLVDANDDPDAEWTYTFCTDAPMRSTIFKHHDMLAAHNADISHFSMNDSPQMNEKSNVEFAFNDEYGTGSWQGATKFYIDRNDAFQVHKCAKVSMEFSSDIIQ